MFHLFLNSFSGLPVLQNKDSLLPSQPCVLLKSSWRDPRIGCRILPFSETAVAQVGQHNNISVPRVDGALYGIYSIGANYWLPVSEKLSVRAGRCTRAGNLSIYSRVKLAHVTAVQKKW